MKTLREKFGRLVLSRLVVSIGALVMIAPTVGCGDDANEASETSPFEGTYNVTLHTRNTEGCQKEGNPVMQGDQFFQLIDADGSLNYHKCTDADADTCEDAINLSKGFTEQVDDMWRKIDITAEEIRLNGDDFGCDVTLTERTAVLDGQALTIEQFTYEGEIEREGDQDCTHELVRANRGALICEAYEKVTALTAD